MIEFDRASYDAIVEHAREGTSEEVCGVLGGEHGEERSHVETVHRARNVAETPETRYHIDPEQQLELIDGIEEAGRDVVGFYHSHPAGPTEPSETDADRATWPGFSYVIVALDGEPFVGAWRWNGENERFEGEIVRVVGDRR
ncbi:desampylase [Halalkalicoccus ordinarius]|uniref:desampylase n=1 Tax=Halalkalicoccus ordinarius TaxID=3116651 RepID=UPI00300F368D